MATADFERVPVIDVHRENFEKHKNSIYEAIDAASFIALDCELSGLGDRKKLNTPSIDERYKHTSLVAKTRSIISLGLAMYKLRPPGEDGMEAKAWHYEVKTYNIMVLCSEDYIVEPGSLRFLVEHGFDFSKQYSLGIGYLRGNDKEKPSPQPLRDLFSRLVRSRRSVVLHNGLIDLIFLYHNLYAFLPELLQTFVADLTSMFPAGIYDTKYIADFVSRTQASYLEYIFRKEQRVNAEKENKGRPHIKLSFPHSELESGGGDVAKDMEWRFCGLEDGVLEEEICLSYANHGHCVDGGSCKLSHNIDTIISKKDDESDKKRAKKRRRKDDSSEPDQEDNGGKVQIVSASDDGSTNGSKVMVTEGVEENGTEVVEENGTKEHAQNNGKEAKYKGGHRAGYDAFMTGFAFATFLVHQTQLPANPADFLPKTICAEKLVDNIYLVGKEFPLLLKKSSFAKHSVQHDAKMKKLDAEVVETIE